MMGSQVNKSCEVLGATGTSHTVRVCVPSKKNSVLRGKIGSDSVEMELTPELHSDVYMGYEGMESNHPVFKWPETIL